MHRTILLFAALAGIASCEVKKDNALPFCLEDSTYTLASSRPDFQGIARPMAERLLQRSSFLSARGGFLSVGNRGRGIILPDGDDWLIEMDSGIPIKMHVDCIAETIDLEDHVVLTPIFLHFKKTK